MKVLSASDIKKWDQFTIEHEPINSYALMERACHVFVDTMMEDFPVADSVHVVCGTGNNGGDGLVIARLLSLLNWRVKVWVVEGKASEDFFKAKLDYEKTTHSPIIMLKSVNEGTFNGCAVLIDALFGSGLSRPLSGLYAQVVQEMNATKAWRLAVDMPSGLLADDHSEGTIFKAHCTYTFQTPKKYLMENHR